MIKDLFDFTGRLQRMDYFLKSLAVIVSVGILVALVIASEAAPVITIIAGIGIIVGSIYGWKIATQRTRDTGLNPWFVLLNLIPYAGIAFGIFLLFAPSDAFSGNDVVGQA